MACAAWWTAGAAGQVELRGGYVIDAPIVSVSAAGVEVGGESPRTIGWGAVKRLGGTHAASMEPFAAVSDAAWRGRTRLARGDVGLAAPLFEELYVRYAGGEGPTALTAAQGALTCRLARGERAGALAAWLDAARLRGAGVRSPADPPLRPVVDSETLLAPALAPVWLAGSDDAAAAAATADAALRSAGGPADGSPARALAWLFRAAADAESSRLYGPADAPAWVLASEHEGVRLVSAMVRSRLGSAPGRATAREELRGGLTGSGPAWAEAWRRVALGRSLLLEDEHEARTDGLIHLAHVAARFRSAQPRLAAVALAEMSLELERRGETGESASIAAELDGLPGADASRAWLDRRRAATPAGGPAGRDDQDGDGGRDGDPGETTTEPHS